MVWLILIVYKGYKVRALAGGFMKGYRGASCPRCIGGKLFVYELDVTIEEYYAECINCGHVIWNVEPAVWVKREPLAIQG